MKRFHVHVSVEDLAASVRFYSSLFGAQPTVAKSDYAKWMMDEPAVNFAISQRGAEPGIDHLGIQTDDEAELQAMKDQAESADLALRDEGTTTCCYTRSEKHWITDPQGIAWEHFRSLENIPTFAETKPADEKASPCCAPAASDKPRQKAVGIPVKSAAKSACC
jgi:hypothetical protein